MVLADRAPDPQAAVTLTAFAVAGVVGGIVGLVSIVGLFVLLPGTLRTVRANREAWAADVARQRSSRP
jgi:hypothetical protein